MKYTEEDLIPLKKALLSGTTSVKIGERQVNFQSITELKKLIADIERSIAADEGEYRSPNKIQATWKK